jgi:PilZ domain
MGKRREPRHAIRLPVRIFGTDAEGQLFSENVFSYDISPQGARLDGVKAKIKEGEVIGVTYGKNKGRFTVKWAGKDGTSQAGQLGLVTVTPEKNLWDTPLPSAGVDTYVEPAVQGDRRQGERRNAGERRDAARLKCVLSVQIQPEGQSAPIWGKAVDMSMGGCFIEMPIPLQKGTKVKIGIWINDNKLRASGRVVSSRPGFGIGVQFSEISQMEADQLRDFLKSITQIPM